MLKIKDVAHPIYINWSLTIAGICGSNYLQINIYENKPFKEKINGGGIKEIIKRCKPTTIKKIGS